MSPLSLTLSLSFYPYLFFVMLLFSGHGVGDIAIAGDYSNGGLGSPPPPPPPPFFPPFSFSLGHSYAPHYCTPPPPIFHFPFFFFSLIFPDRLRTLFGEAYSERLIQMCRWRWSLMYNQLHRYCYSEVYSLIPALQYFHRVFSFLSVLTCDSLLFNTFPPPLHLYFF